MHDFVIIGAGVVGASIAHELSRYKVSVLWLEAETDVSLGASKANSGIVHAGYDPEPSTIKARLNVEGAQLMKGLCEDLSVTYQDQPTMVVAHSKSEVPALEELLKRGKLNGVKDMEILSGSEARLKEPLLLDSVESVFYVPSGVVSPYELTIALAEQAQINGVDLHLGTKVMGMVTDKDKILVSAIKKKGGSLEALTPCVINCAGGFSDKIARMVGDDSFVERPVKGEYLIFDRDTDYPLGATLFPVPDPVRGKGILVALTPDGNVMVGPNAEPTDSMTDTATDLPTLEAIYAEALKTVKYLPPINRLIRSFSGVRPKITRKDGVKDFLIAPSLANPALWNVVGIDSPGLTSAPAIARYLVGEFGKLGWLGQAKPDFASGRNPLRGKDLERVPVEKSKEFTDLSLGTPERIVCRCQSVRESSIRDTVNRWREPLSVEGVKRRTRAGMGLCQGAFCRSRVKEVLADIYKVSPNKIQERDEDFTPNRPSLVDLKKSLDLKILKK